MLALLTLSALASPTFVDGDHSSTHLVQPATEAYAAGAKCMGRPADVPGTIRIVAFRPGLEDAPDQLIQNRDHAWIGSSVVGIRGNDRFEKDSTDWELRALHHQIAHLWATGSIWAVNEGGADSLADCIAAELGRLDLRMGDRTRAALGEPLVQMGPGFSEPTNREHALAQSWVRALLTRIPLSDLFPSEPEDWATARKRLEPAGLLVDLAEHPLPASALVDGDGDWLPSGFERALGLSDADQRSREDGWWDSAPKVDAPEGTTQIVDSTWQCSGWVFPKGAAIRYRGWDLQGPWVGPLETADPRGRVVRGPAPRAIWAEAPAKRDDTCQSSSGTVVLRDSSRISRDEVATLLGQLDSAGIVVLGGTTRITARAVHIGDDLLATKDPGLPWLIEALAGAQQMGVCPDPALIAEEIRIRSEATTLAHTELVIACEL